MLLFLFSGGKPKFKHRVEPCKYFINPMWKMVFQLNIWDKYYSEKNYGGDYGSEVRVLRGLIPACMQCHVEESLGKTLNPLLSMMCPITV